ncbi:MAG: hypothetical protein Udaeo2_09230 [Candidatus Udaeobacter sp.]|nr:MAG: hypothetical protein Udaeo2_09230 [Candidatus Udaeobacter sp.]
MRSKFAAIGILIAALSASSRAFGFPFTRSNKRSLSRAQSDIEIARKKQRAGGWVEARSGYLPWLSSTGLVDKRQQQSQSELRQEDYNVISSSNRIFTLAEQYQPGGHRAVKYREAEL